MRLNLIICFYLILSLLGAYIVGKEKLPGNLVLKCGIGVKSIFLFNRRLAGREESGSQIRSRVHQYLALVWDLFVYFVCFSQSCMGRGFQFCYNSY